MQLRPHYMSDTNMAEMPKCFLFVCLFLPLVGVRLDLDKLYLSQAEKLQVANNSSIALKFYWLDTWTYLTSMLR